jgi:OmcA/MtrC family decaheme c-type cytochrome
MLRGALALLACTTLLLAGCNGSNGSNGQAGPPGPPGSEPLEDGFEITIGDATVGPDLRVSLEFTLADGDGNPAELADLARDPSFVLGHIEVDPTTGRSRFRGDIGRSVTGADYVADGMTISPALAGAAQVTSDSGGTFESLAPGSYRYVYGSTLPAGYNPSDTYRVATYVDRDDGTVGNAVFDFVPSGARGLVTRDIVTTQACNQCHDPLAEHGGRRQEVGLCVVCHTDQTVDPETGNNVEFRQMIHKIHRGEDLSNQPYRVVGFRQSLHDYSTVVFPQDARNCTTCHQGGVDSDNWRTRPSRTACSSCHDEVNFATGENHQGIVQMNDDQCSTCHPAEEMTDIDLSIPGVHTNPYKSVQNPRLTLAITDIVDLMPGMQPEVRFTITNSSGPVNITNLDRVAIVFAGPTTDYSQLISIDHRFTIQGGGARGTLVTHAVGDYSYLPDGYMIPFDAMGTWSVGMEARTRELLIRGELTRLGANNPVADVDVTFGVLGMGNPVPRRTVVETASCNVCHNDFRIHGDLRTEVPYCTMCHNPVATDEGQRPDVDPVMNPPETISFPVLIHKIHRGEDLMGDYTVFGFGRNPHDYTEVRFPGDLRNCAKCHSDDSQLLPVPRGARTRVINIAGVTVPQDHAILTPTTAACTACHDGPEVMTHAMLNSIVNDELNWAESCTVCHGEGSTQAVSDVHRR